MLLFDFTFILHSQSFQNKSIYKHAGVIHELHLHAEIPYI